MLYISGNHLRKYLQNGEIKISYGKARFFSCGIFDSVRVDTKVKIKKYFCI